MVDPRACFLACLWVAVPSVWGDRPPAAPGRQSFGGVSGAWPSVGRGLRRASPRIAGKATPLRGITPSFEATSTQAAKWQIANLAICLPPNASLPILQRRRCKANGRCSVMPHVMSTVSPPPPGAATAKAVRAPRPDCPWSGDPCRPGGCASD
jgi:hypothetical protein